MQHVAESRAFREDEWHAFEQAVPNPNILVKVPPLADYVDQLIAICIPCIAVPPT